jgi:hypothetical protein
VGEYCQFFDPLSIFLPEPDMEKTFKPYTIRDLMSCPDKRPRHPKVKYNRENLTIDIDTGNYTYDVDLERIPDAAELLDWMFQLREKEWMTADMMEAFISEFEDACFDALGTGARSTFCHGKREVKWPTVEEMKAKARN